MILDKLDSVNREIANFVPSLKNPDLIRLFNENLFSKLKTLESGKISIGTKKYSLNEIFCMIDAGEYNKQLVNFRENLLQEDLKVFSAYNYLIAKKIEIEKF